MPIRQPFFPIFNRVHAFDMNLLWVRGEVRQQPVLNLTTPNSRVPVLSFLALVHCDIH